MSSNFAGSVYEQIARTSPTANSTMSPRTDAIMRAPIVFQEDDVPVVTLQLPEMGIEAGQNAYMISDGNPMLAQMPTPQMVAAAPQIAATATADQDQAWPQKSLIVRPRVLDPRRQLDFLDLIKAVPQGELEGILGDTAVQPDGGGGDSGAAPPPSLEQRTEGRHDVWDVDLHEAEISSLYVEPESSVLLPR